MFRCLLRVLVALQTKLAGLALPSVSQTIRRSRSRARRPTTNRMRTSCLGQMMRKALTMRMSGCQNQQQHQRRRLRREGVAVKVEVAGEALVPVEAAGPADAAGQRLRVRLQQLHRQQHLLPRHRSTSGRTSLSTSSRRACLYGRSRAACMCVHADYPPRTCLGDA